MAKDTNMVIIVGRLTRDAELKYTNSGAAITNISVANTKVRKNGDQWEEDTNFFEATLFGRQGEALNQYLQKGQQVSLTGELDYQSWEKDGQKRSKVVIKVNNVQLLGGKKDNSNGGGSTNINNSYNKPVNNKPSYDNNGPNNANFEDEIPFWYTVLLNIS